VAVLAVPAVRNLTDDSSGGAEQLRARGNSV